MNKGQAIISVDNVKRIGWNKVEGDIVRSYV